MKTIAQCRKTLEKHGEKYTDEEIIQIRDQLYSLANFHIADMELKEEKERKNKLLKKKDEKSNNLYKSGYN